MNLHKLLYIILHLITSVFSYVILVYNTGGDQKTYRKYFELLHNADISDLTNISFSTLTSSGEFLSYVIYWLGANSGLDKDMFSLLLNVALISSVYYYCWTKKLPIWMVVLITTNFYFIMLMSSAERLKIGLIFASLSLLTTGRYKVILLIMSVFGHLQNAILVFLMFIKAGVSRRTLNISSKYLLIIPLFFLILFSDSINYYFEVIYSKVYDYYKGVNYSDALKVLLFYVVLVMATKVIKLSDLVLFLFIFMLGLILGGSRLNMIAFIVIFLIVLERNSYKSPYFILLMLYFSIKSILFLENIFVYNNGFYGDW
jgi:hypothetical protein